MILIVTIVNFAIIIGITVGIIVVVYSLIKRFNKFTNRNMEIDKNWIRF
jgi:MFS superfamily sulfate permease-like transporter